jgi:WD40 repeat protein/predicted Ser/Thr protein kinase
MADDEDGGGFELRRAHTLSSSSMRPRTVPLGIETQRQKAELETALFGEPHTPIEIDHYTVIGTLGSGGMGVVYVAQDQQLGRRVALKLLRHATASEVARARLQREAQAMARLSHPNVVTVHEVGTFRGQVFLAMEFVGGANLRAWLHMRKRGWRETVATFIQAGEGLAAAHDAGIIHRDFKPDNVLVGDDGRVRVADFGLAHGLDTDLADPTPDTHDSNPSRPGLPLDSPLTETGTIVGTPAYMAPEQHENSNKVDARCDQFAFCVALWEGLYGKRPFPGAGLAELRLALKEGRILHPADPGDVPPWLHRVILRGLAIDPANRWPSMRELLVALARDPELVRRRRLSIAALTFVTLTIMVSLSVRAATESRHNSRHRYWTALTEQLLDIERERGFRQATDDASRARNATRMSSYRRYRPEDGRVDHEDPTVAAALLREVEGSGRETQDWISAANEILGQPISYAVLDGHRNVIMDIAFAPDSSAVYTASYDNEVRRWDLETGVGRTIITHEREVIGVAISPDGKLVASGSKDRTARLWSSDNPNASRLITEHDSELTDVAFDPSGRLLATAAKDGTIKLVSLASGTTRSLAGHIGPVHALSFSADGEQLLTAGNDHSARLWRVADGSQLATFVGHDDAVYHARFIDETQIVTGSDDGTVRLWHVRRPAPPELLTRHATAITALDVHHNRVASASVDKHIRIVELAERTMIEFVPPAVAWSLAFVADGEQLVTGAFDGNARLWSRHGGAPLRTFVGHREAVLRIAVDPSGRWLASGSYDTDLRLWDLRRPGLRQSLDGHGQQLSDIVFDPAERMIATASHDGGVRLWSVEEARELTNLQIGDDAIYSVAFSPDAAYLAAGTHSTGVALWRLDDQSLRILEGHETEVWQVAFDSTGRRLASASLDGTVRIWNVADGREQLVLRGHAGVVTTVQFEPGDRRIISAANDGTIRIWDAQSGANIATWHAHDGKIWRLVRSPDGHTLATVSDDGTAKLWPDDNPAHVIELRGHRQPVFSVAFDPGGARVVTASYDKDAKIWDTADGSLLRTLSGHSETVWGARFTSDGRVVTASEDNTLRVWPRDLGDPVLVLSGHGDAVTALAINRAGTRLVSGSADATAKIWHLDRLLTEVEPLHERLRQATIWCLSIDRRIREFGEEEVEATQAFATCEAAYGRHAEAIEQPRSP